MNTLKKHFSLILPLLALLFSLQSIILVNRTIVIKEKKLSQSYSILLSSSKKINFELISRNIQEAKSIQIISPDSLLERLKQNMTEANVVNIKKDLPMFYSLKLSTFPDRNRLEAISKILSRTPDILKVEAFSKTHNQVYRLLYFVKINVWIFGLLLTILSVLLIIRQIQIWRFEHSKRMEIMSFLGAPMWIKNGSLFKLALVDSLIGSACISVGSFYLSFQSGFAEIINSLEVQGEIFKFGLDFLIMFLTAITISVFSVLVVILAKRKT